MVFLLKKAGKHPDRACSLRKVSNGYPACNAVRDFRIHDELWVLFIQQIAPGIVMLVTPGWKAKMKRP